MESTPSMADTEQEFQMQILKLTAEHLAAIRHKNAIINNLQSVNQQKDQQLNKQKCNSAKIQGLFQPFNHQSTTLYHITKTCCSKKNNQKQL